MCRRRGVGAYSRGEPQALILDRRLAWFVISNRDDHEHDDEDDNDWRVLKDGASTSGKSESSTNISVSFHWQPTTHVS
jgi:hypothetical protein